MLTPSLFNENFDLFDCFYPEPWFRFNDREFKNLEKKLYGHRAKNVMNTDIKESDAEYEMTIDLPGFKKEEEKKGNYIRRERYSGSCQRSFYIGDAVTVADIKANFKHL